MSPYPSAKPQLPGKQEIALAVGRASWWVPHRGMRRKKRPSFAEELRDFISHLSFPCYGKMVERRRSRMERAIWMLFHALALTVLITFLWRTYDTHGRLLSTTIYDSLYPINKVAFPAVSICSQNRISKASAIRYAEELNNKDPLQRGADFFYNEINMLNYNYFTVGDAIDYERALTFQKFLDIYDANDSELFYNTRRRLKMLTPLCEDILVKCYLGGREFNCLDKFVESLTEKGYCCTFNHDGEYAKERSIQNRFFGADEGLVVHLNASRDDDYSSRDPAMPDFSLLVYAANNFAEVFSGGVRERFIQTGIDSFVALSAQIIETVSQARYLSPKVRNCLFENEAPRIFGKSYTFNKCIQRCRMHSVMVLCQCLPFYAAHEFLDITTEAVYCTLQHKSCLKRYNFKWLNVITLRRNMIGLEREMEDALYCPDCLPSCCETRYEISMMGIPLNQYSSDIVVNNSNSALVRVFFGKPHVKYLRQIINDDWFEVFSTIGGICSIIAGFSLIGICEILFFLGRHSINACRREISCESKQKSKPGQRLLILP